jgi:hypothetical protein
MQQHKNGMRSVATSASHLHDTNDLIATSQKSASHNVQVPL